MLIEPLKDRLCLDLNPLILLTKGLVFVKNTCIRAELLEKI